MDTILKPIIEFWEQLQGGAVIAQFGAWNYLFLALMVMVQGPISTLLGAAAAAAGFMQLPFVFLAAALGNLSADLLYYSLGYSGKIQWALRLGKHVGLTQQHLDRLTQSMNQHAPKILLVAKLTWGLIIPSLVAAGLARVPIRRWLPFLVFAETIWTGILTLSGYFAAESIKKVKDGVEYLGLAAVVLGCAVIFIILLRRYIRRNKNLQAATQIIAEEEKLEHLESKKGSH